MDSLGIRERTLVLLAVSTGLRQSELFGLKWGDIDIVKYTMNVTRSIVYGVVGPCKTESSQKPVPVHPRLADALSDWRKQCVYTKPDDWVFASRRYRGRRPYWGQAILRKYVRPTAQRVGIQKCIGWHTFRHTYSTLLRSVGTEFKVCKSCCGIRLCDPPWMCIPRRSRLRNMQLRQRFCRWCFRAKRTQRHYRLYQVALQREDHRRNWPGEKCTQKRAQNRAPFGSSMVSPKLTQVL